MVETYRPKPFKERESQKVGFVDLAKWLGQLALVGVIGYGVGYGGGRVAKDYFGKNVNPKMAGYITGKVSALVKLFMIWRKKEKTRLGVEDLNEDLPKALEMHWDKEKIEKDNTLLKDMVAFERDKQEKLLQAGGGQVAGAVHEGKVKESPQQAQEAAK